MVAIKGSSSKRKNYVGSSKSSSSSKKSSSSSKSSSQPSNVAAIMNPYLAQTGKVSTPVATPTPQVSQPTAPAVSTPTPSSSNRPNLYNPVNPMTTTSTPAAQDNHAAAAAMMNPYLVSKGVVEPAPIQTPSYSPAPGSAPQATQAQAQSSPTSNNTGSNYTPNSVQVLYPGDPGNPYNNTAPTTAQNDPSMMQKILDGLSGKNFKEQYPNATYGSIGGTVGLFTVGAAGLISKIKTFLSGAKATNATSKALMVGSGAPGMSIGGVPNAINTKNVKIVNNIITKELGSKGIVPTALKWGAAITAAASATFLGQWAQAEAGEPLSVAMRDIAFEARKTGDYTLYDEAKALRDNILDLNIWEKMALWTPLAPAVGIPNKLAGVTQAALIMDKFMENQKIATQTMETPQQTYAREYQQRQADYQNTTNYYNQQRQQMLEWELEARQNAREEEAAFWLKQKEKQMELEAQEREATAKFWLEYKKLSAKMDDNNRPSKLNFGIL